MPLRPRTKAESDKEAVASGHGTVRAIRSACKTNIGGNTGLSSMNHKPSRSPKCQLDLWLGLNARARGKLLHEMDPCRCCFPRGCSRFDVDSIPLEGHSFGSGRAHD